MKLPKIKIDYTGSPRPGLGVFFPGTDYIDMVITFFIVDINFKWRKR